MFTNLKTFFSVCRTKSTFLLAVSGSVSSGNYRHHDIGESLLSFHLPDSVLGARHPSVKTADKYPIKPSFWGRQKIKPQRVRSSVIFDDSQQKKKKEKKKTSRAWIVPYSRRLYLGYSIRGAQAATACHRGTPHKKGETKFKLKMSHLRQKLSLSYK